MFGTRVDESRTHRHGVRSPRSKEAQASSEIENIVTTADRLFCYANDTAGRADPATREALRYRTALHRGFEMLNQLPVSVAIAVEVCRTIKGVELDIRNTPRTALLNDSTDEVIYTPPEGEDVLRSKLANWGATSTIPRRSTPRSALRSCNISSRRSIRSSTETIEPDAC
ncbi:MAG: hypothetical protein OXI81_01745 [Paracoccaceae bacterium]|nr:hypothetical protein [Paracoccaceae bacterium]